jgi:hypothetical protein
MAEEYGYVDMIFDGMSCPFGYCDPLIGTPIAVSLGTVTTGVDFALEPTGGVAGTVVEGASGLPVGSARVTAWHADFGYISDDWTNSTGNYTLTHLPAGNFFVVSDEGIPYLDQLSDEGHADSGYPRRGHPRHRSRTPRPDVGRLH